MDQPPSRVKALTLQSLEYELKKHNLLVNPGSQNRKNKTAKKPAKKVFFASFFAVFFAVFAVFFAVLFSRFFSRFFRGFEKQGNSTLTVK